MKGIWRNILDILEYKDFDTGCAFLDAVNNLPAVEELPDTATAEEIAALQALVDACQEAYGALLEADKALDDVIAAVEQMDAVSKKILAQAANASGLAVQLQLSQACAIGEWRPVEGVHIGHIQSRAGQRSNGCTSLETVTLKDIKTIGEQAFLSSSLKTVTMKIRSIIATLPL